MAKIYHKFNTTVESKANSTTQIPIRDGQFLIVTDTKKLMYDYGGARITLGDIIELDTEAQRAALVTPLNKFYFVKDTGALWRYQSGTWKEWADQDTVQAHIDQMIQSDDGVHGLRFSSTSKVFELYNITSKSWEPVSMGGNSEPVYCTLSASGWSNGEQVMTVTGLGKDQNGVAGLTQDISAAGLEAAKNAELFLCGQGDGTLTVVANGTVPTCDIPVVVILLS
jgi:hypothetical protein